MRSLGCSNRLLHIRGTRQDEYSGQEVEGLGDTTVLESLERGESSKIYRFEVGSILGVWMRVLGENP